MSARGGWALGFFLPPPAACADRPPTRPPRLPLAPACSRLKLWWPDQAGLQLAAHPTHLHGAPAHRALPRLPALVGRCALAVGLRPVLERLVSLSGLCNAAPPLAIAGHSHARPVSCALPPPHPPPQTLARPALAWTTPRPQAAAACPPPPGPAWGAAAAAAPAGRCPRPCTQEAAAPWALPHPPPPPARCWRGVGGTRSRTSSPPPRAPPARPPPPAAAAASECAGRRCEGPTPCAVCVCASPACSPSRCPTRQPAGPAHRPVAPRCSPLILCPPLPPRPRAGTSNRSTAWTTTSSASSSAPAACNRRRRRLLYAPAHTRFRGPRCSLASHSPN